MNFDALPVDSSVSSGGEVLQATRHPGGLFVISERLPYSRSIALGFAYRLGSRNDPPGQEGTAHLIEHMIFKGTERLDAKAINVAAETHGAELNGFTDKEGTCFYGRVPAEQVEPVTQLLVEILSAPAFREAELVKEKQVVQEEIRSSEEDPESCAINLLFEAIYGESPLGRPVIGTTKSIAGITSDDLRRFYQAHYGAGCAVAVGDIEHERLMAMLARYAPKDGHTPGSQPPVRLERFRGLSHTRKEISQVYVCLARPAFSYTDQRRYALSVLNAVLGGGVSSRLFQRLREEEGLVYSIGSFTELYEDSGVLGIYFIAEGSKMARCVAVLREELVRLRQERIGNEEFERARTMVKSAVVLGLESSISRMLRLARSYLILGRVLSVEEVLAAYNRLSREAVEQLIDDLLGEDRFYAGVVGPVSQSEVERILL